ncbi:MAG: triose-phosphate isomerase [Chitinophagales bacterium]
MRAKIVAGNWKMNKTAQEAVELTQAIAEGLQNVELNDYKQVIVCPPSLFLSVVQNGTKNSKLQVGAQNCHQNDAGAYTGEISALMLQSLDIQYVILGHSERRSYFGETDELIKEKTDKALAYDLKVIYCCGEQLAVRETGAYFDLVKEQISTALFHLSPTQLQNVVIAYEPVWAIGTGVTASPEQAEEMHAFIRQLLAKQYNQETADAMTILYGGSCKPSNAAALFSKPNVDGGLIGGAALEADSFLGIIEAM